MPKLSLLFMLQEKNSLRPVFQKASVVHNCLCLVWSEGLFWRLGGLDLASDDEAPSGWRSRP